jgi:hypothetical protein
MALVATAPIADKIVDAGYIVSSVNNTNFQRENKNANILSSRLDDLDDPTKWITHEEGVRLAEEKWAKYKKENKHLWN